MKFKITDKNCEPFIPPDEKYYLKNGYELFLCKKSWKFFGDFSLPCQVFKGNLYLINSEGNILNNGIMCNLVAIMENSDIDTIYDIFQEYEKPIY